MGWTMRADAQRRAWTGLVLALALLTTGCASLTPLPSRRAHLLYAPGVPRSPSVSAESQRPYPRPASPSEVTTTAPDNSARAVRQRALTSQLAFRRALREVADSTSRISGEFARLNTRMRSHPQGSPAFTRYADYGVAQARWVETQLAAAARLADMASEVDHPDMQLALLRVAGPRMEAALLGSLLLAVWVDILLLVDVALTQHLVSVETLFADVWRWQEMLTPTMMALSSTRPGQVETAAQNVPPLIGHLTEEVVTTVERMRVGAEKLQKVWVIKEAIETATMFSTMRFSLPSLPPSTPPLVGIALVVGGDGVMMGTRMVVSTEWVRRVHQLVQAGVLSLPVISAAVRIQANQVVLAQAHGELPEGVREALGEGPEVAAMHETGKAGAGMAEPPRHHVMPKEFREWFEKRGFTGEMDIDQFCVKLEQATHEAIHGGGSWRLGRIWAGEWNRLIMSELRDAEMLLGRQLTRNEILERVAFHMKRYDIPMQFSPWMGR